MNGARAENSTASNIPNTETQPSFEGRFNSTRGREHEFTTNVHDEGYISLLDPNVVPTNEARGLDHDTSPERYREFRSTSHFTSSVVKSEVMSISQTFLTSQENVTEQSIAHSSTIDGEDTENTIDYSPRFKAKNMRYNDVKDQCDGDYAWSTKDETIQRESARMISNSEMGMSSFVSVHEPQIEQVLILGKASKLSKQETLSDDSTSELTNTDTNLLDTSNPIFQFVWSK